MPLRAASLAPALALLAAPALAKPQRAPASPCLDLHRVVCGESASVPACFSALTGGEDAFASQIVAQALAASGLAPASAAASFRLFDEPTQEGLANAKDPQAYIASLKKLDPAEAATYLGAVEAAALALAGSSRAELTAAGRRVREAQLAALAGRLPPATLTRLGETELMTAGDLARDLASGRLAPGTPSALSAANSLQSCGPRGLEKSGSNLGDPVMVAALGRRVVLCPGALLEAARATRKGGGSLQDQLAALLGHELGHSLDVYPGSAPEPALAPVRQCLERHGIAFTGVPQPRSTPEQRQAQARANFSSEATADIAAAEGLARLAEDAAAAGQARRDATARLLSASLRFFLCGNPDCLKEAGYGSGEFRINALFGAHPALRRELGCPAVAEEAGHPRCALDGAPSAR